MRIFSYLLFFIINIGFNFYSFSADQSFYKSSQDCNKFLNEGWIKQYKYQGVGDPKYNPTESFIFGSSKQSIEITSEGGSSKATREEGSTVGSSLSSTEDSTAVIDPKWWSNHVMDAFVYRLSSSGRTGPCKYSTVAKNKIKEIRELYFVKNNEDVLKEISRGSGEHLNVLAELSLCDKKSYPYFATAMQQNMDAFLNSKNKGKIIDGVIKNTKSLSLECESVTI